jgi:hypothetical protein
MTSSGSSLQSKVAQRDQLLQVLQEETAQLLKNHSFALEEVNERQQLIAEMECKLKLSQTHCDALEGQVIIVMII